MRMDWPALKTAVAECTACPLHAKRKNTVFGVGDENAAWMFVGEGPGADEGELLGLHLHRVVAEEHHLERVLREFETHYNADRPHRGLELAVPEPLTTEVSSDGTVGRRDRLGGLIHEYYREAA